MLIGWCGVPILLVGNLLFAVINRRWPVIIRVHVTAARNQEVLFH